MKKRINFKFIILVIVLLAIIALGVCSYIKGVREHEQEAQLVFQTAKAYIGIA
jgi:hypothetical protein